MGTLESYDPSAEHVSAGEIELSVRRDAERELGARAAIMAEAFDEGDGGGHSPDCHTNDPAYQDSFTA